MGKPQTQEGTKKYGLVSNRFEHLYVLSAFTMKAAVQRDIPHMLECIEQLSDEQKDQLVIAAVEIIKHTTANQAIHRVDLAREVKGLENDNQMLLLRIDELRRKLLEAGIDIDKVDKRERA